MYHYRVQANRSPKKTSTVFRQNWNNSNGTKRRKRLIGRFKLKNGIGHSSITAQSHLNHISITAQSQLNHSSITAQLQLNHSSITAQMIMNEMNRVQRKFENMLKKIRQALSNSEHIKYKVDKVESVLSWRRQIQDE